MQADALLLEHGDCVLRRQDTAMAPGGKPGANFHERMGEAIRRPALRAQYLATTGPVQLK
jgi:hypothetical protein